MLQSWLFFGFLEAGFSASVPSFAFVVPTPNGPVLNTRKIHNLMGSTEKGVNGMSVARKQTYLENMRASRAEFFGIVATLNNLYGGAESRKVFDEEGLAGVLRVATLVGEMHYLLEQGFPIAWRRGMGDDMLLPYAHINKRRLLERLRRKGWCPSVYHRLMRYGFSTLEYASLLESLDRPVEKHDGCSTKQCLANNVDEATYETKHLTPGCTCETIKPPLDDALRVLNAGNFFLINIGALLNPTTSTGSPAIVPYTPSTPFTAFSHIWSDGLGSATEHGLPRCQLTCLSTLAKPTANIWIDSLCIPHSPAARRAAIRQMSQIYALATTTIVLDAGLRAYDIEDRPPQELAVRILSSAWMQRLWTLQEGSLARALQFVVRDCILVSAEFLLRVIENSLRCPILMQLRGALVTLAQGQEGLSVEQALGMTSGRTSSKSEDETVAVAPLVGLDVGKLLETPGAGRMALFWRLLERVPGGVLFVGGPKLTEEGLRWAPRSFGEGGDLVLKGEDARITEQGLVGEWWVVGFEKREEIRVREGYFIHDCGRHGGEEGCRGTPAAHMSLFAVDQEEAFFCDAVAFKECPVPGTPDLCGVSLLRVGVEGETEVFRYGGRVIVSDHGDTILELQEHANKTRARGGKKLVCIS